MPVAEPQVRTFAFLDLLCKKAPEASRALVIRSAPLRLISEVLRELKTWKAWLEISLYRHPGEAVAGYDNIIYPHAGYFRFDLADIAGLRARGFDFVVVPYATDRRLHPEYHEVDRIASGIGASSVINYYWDARALAVDRVLLNRKLDRVVQPYLLSKQKAVAEICAFTGEDPLTAEEKCHQAAALGNSLWLDVLPGTAEEIDRFYRENDFYIYALMKECDWQGARMNLFEPVREELKPGWRVLDYGGGCGALGLELARAGFDLTHLDLPGALLEFARFRFRKNGLKVKVIEATEKYPLRERYDAIICTHVLEHLPDPEEKLRHMADHLKPSGKLILAIPFIPNPVAGVHPEMHLNRLTEERYCTLMADLGFSAPRKIGELDIFQL